MNNKSRLILTDCDGVLLSWEDHFHDYMKSQGHERAYDGPTSYWKEAEYTHLSQDQAQKMLYHFNTSAWMLSVPCFRDARSGVAKLVENGYSFVAITAMGLDPYAKRAREINLETIFGKNVFDDVITTDMYNHDSKKEILEYYKEIAPGVPWIEDRPGNAELGASMGFDTYLIEHKYNQEYEPVNDIKSVSNWQQICNYLLDID